MNKKMVLPSPFDLRPVLFLGLLAFTSALECNRKPTAVEIKAWQGTTIYQSLSSGSGNWFISIEPEQTANESVGASESDYLHECVDDFRVSFLNKNTQYRFHTDVPNILNSMAHVRLVGQCMKYDYSIVPLKRGAVEARSGWFPIHEKSVNINTRACNVEQQDQPKPSECRHPVSMEDKLLWSSMAIQPTSQETGTNEFSLTVATHKLYNITAVKSCVVNFEVRVISAKTTLVTIVDKHFWSEYQLHFENLDRGDQYRMEIRALKVGEVFYANNDNNTNWLKPLKYDNIKMEAVGGHGSYPGYHTSAGAANSRGIMAIWAAALVLLSLAMI